jgi:NADPH:quinone reductase
MRAVVSTDYGRGPTLAQVDTPEPGPGEVRVRVRASSLNGFDTALVRGFFQGIMPHRFPVVLGRDFAGTIDRVGAGVTRFAAGDDVFGVVLTQPLHAGGFADYLVVAEDHSIGSIPPGLGHATAGAMGLAGSAAIAALQAIQPQSGETVLVSGATGGVGAFALQMLAASDVTPIATAGSETEASHVRSLGAAHVVDHTDDVAAQVREIVPGGADAVLHFAGDPSAVRALTADGGRFASLLIMDAKPFAVRGIRATAVVAAPHRALLEGLAADVVAGRLTVPIQRTYPLAAVPDAFADFAAGTVGKLAVDVAG